MVLTVNYVFIFFFIGKRVFKKSKSEFQNKYSATGFVYIFFVYLAFFYKLFKRINPKFVGVFVTALTVEGRPYTLAVTDPAPEIKKLFSPKI